MSETHERAIRDLLMNEQKSEVVAHILYKRACSGRARKEECISISNFLFNSGHYKELLLLLSHEFKNAEALNDLKYLQKIFSNLHHKPEQKIQTAIQQAEELLYIKLKDKFEAKLEYFRSNRMVAEEKKIILARLQKHPNELNLRARLEELNKSWAEELLSRKAPTNKEKKMYTPRPPELTAAEKDFANVLKQELLQISRRKPHMRYNLALTAFFIELYNVAREILLTSNELGHSAGPVHPPTPSEDWFEIEVVLRSQLYAEALDVIARVESKYSDDPETAFGVTYYRAQALAGLGQQNTAIELLKSIVQIRPQYRAAHSLLMKWRGE